MSRFPTIQPRRGGAGTPATYQGVLGPAVSLANMNAMLRVHLDNAAYVRRLYEGQDVLRFQSFDLPITETHAPSYESTTVLGRSEDYLSYSGTANRRVSITLNFSASLERNDQGEEDQAVRCTRWIQSFCYPTYRTGGLMHPPALVNLVIGRLINMRGVVTACDLSYEGPFSGLSNKFEYPIYAKANVEITSVNPYPKQASDFIPRIGSPIQGI